jgi:hypothetical protein
MFDEGTSLKPSVQLGAAVSYLCHDIGLLEAFNHVPHLLRIWHEEASANDTPQQPQARPQPKCCPYPCESDLHADSGRLTHLGMDASIPAGNSIMVLHSSAEQVAG